MLAPELDCAAERPRIAQAGNAVCAHTLSQAWSGWTRPHPIRRADLEAWERKVGVKIGPGDIQLLYIGRWKRRAALGSWTGQVAGYYADTIPWMHERLPSFIGHDFNIDWNPRPGWEGMRNPIHVAVLNWMGINIVECLDLEQVAATARRLNRYDSG